MGELWQAIGGKPRAALNYTVTISVDVKDMGAWMKLENISHQVAIAGLVRNAQTHQGIAGVRVQITGMPAALQAKIDFLAQLYGADWKQRPDRTITGPEGYFYFLDRPTEIIP